MRHVIVILFFLISGISFAQDNNTPVPFTLGDRDRFMRNEQKIDALRTEMNVRFESMQKDMNTRFESVDKQFESMDKQFASVYKQFDAVNERIDDVKEQLGFLTTLMMFVLGGLMSLIGFVIYDRRTAIKPVLRGQDKLEDILVEYAKEDKKLREILKNAGML